MADDKLDLVLNGIVLGDDVVFEEGDPLREEEELPPDIEPDPNESASPSAAGLSVGSSVSGSSSASGSASTVFSLVIGIVAAVFCRLIPHIGAPCWSRIPGSCLTVFPEPGDVEMDEGINSHILLIDHVTDL
jgi:hypothetical protein